MKKVVRNILSFIISLLTMFLILVASVSLILDKTVLNDQTYIKILDEENISKKVEKHIYEDLNYLLISENIPSGTLDGVISKDEIQNQIYDTMYFTVNFMKNRSGEIPALKTETYEKRIDDKINEFVEKNKSNISDEFYANLGQLKSDAVNIISSSLQIIDMSELSQSSAIKLVAKVSSLVSSTMFIGGLIFLIILLSLCHFIIWRGRRKYRGFAWSAYPFISAGIISFLIGFSGYISKFYENVPINIDYIKNTSILIMKRYLLNFTYLGVLVFVVGIIIMSVYWTHLFKVYKRD